MLVIKEYKVSVRSGDILLVAESRVSSWVSAKTGRHSMSRMAGMLLEAFRCQGFITSHIQRRPGGGGGAAHGRQQEKARQNGITVCRLRAVEIGFVMGWVCESLEAPWRSMLVRVWLLLLVPSPLMEWGWKGGPDTIVGPTCSWMAHVR